MKFFIGRLAITEGNCGACHLDQALFVAKDEAQAKDLNDTRAMMWGGDDGRVVVGGAWRFHDEKTGTFTVYPDGVLEISATAFDDLKEWLQVFGDRETAEAEKQEPAEAVKTLARRIGDQLAKHDVKVSHSKLLHAVAASLGLTDWQVAKRTTSDTKPSTKLPEGVRVAVHDLGNGSFQVDGLVDDVRIIEVDNRLDVQSWYLGQTGCLPWKHVDAARSLACINAVFDRVTALSTPGGAQPAKVDGPWFPSGNWPQTKLVDVRQLDFATRVNAIWLTHGDVKLAAKLLHVDAEALMNSFVGAMEADTAFCGRPANWTAKNSLAPNLDAAGWQGHPNGFRTDRHLSLSYTNFWIDGYLGKSHMFRVSNAADKANPTFFWQATSMPYSLREVSLLAECLNEALRQTYEELRVDWTPPKD